MTFTATEERQAFLIFASGIESALQFFSDAALTFADGEGAAMADVIFRFRDLNRHAVLGSLPSTKN